MKHTGTQKTLIHLFLLTLCCVASTVFAIPRRSYDVQVIVFSQLTRQALQSAQWSTVSPAHNKPDLLITPRAAFGLQREKISLARNPNYRIILDASWRETWRGNNSTVTIPVYATKDGAKLSGVISILLGRYFDVHTNLFLTEPTVLLQKIDKDGFFNNWHQPNFTFQMLQDRRMRSDELNYLEHPVIGMLIKITPTNA